MMNSIVALDNDFGIGKDGKIPWHSKEDLEKFKAITSGGVVVMGRRTYESIGNPLPNRLNVVITQTVDDDRVIRYPSLARFIKDYLAGELPEMKGMKIWIIGGRRLYADMLRYKLGAVHITKIVGNYDCDVFFPLMEGWKPYRVNESEHSNLVFEDWLPANSEMEYLALLRKTCRGTPVPSRTGVDCRSITGKSISFDLWPRFPLLTTKRVFFRGVVEELLMFLRGETQTKILEDKKINIWKGNTSAEFLTIRNLPYDEGEMGPMYGYQWRKWTSPSGPIDQLAQVIQDIRTSPHSRRHVVSAWNVSDLERGVLHPCHILYQFHVHDGHLDCSVYQRSADIFLGVPFNIASYGILTHIIAKLTDLIPGKLTMHFGDLHMYETHSEAISEQLRREPRQFPLLSVLVDKPLEQYTYDDFELAGYDPHPAIRAPMAV